ncbi:stalk domain-containing protein [Tepidibacter hydrothermalis]|uniref:Stalk domain-containing protein n=1 Tax=Tepidibacter hydrothermalis TaxID=3036126 RepID=A0ABY8EHM8_9FIRM|nr:stalk domain-containing protein [Tepidibacter hydrothermalis]WFD11089.1 stalk domain-containing protein [Tepidibacter hydrothermalis]
MKKFIKLFALILFVSFSVNNVSFAENPIKVILNDKALHFDVNPTIVNGRTLVPVREIFEALDSKVSWDEKSKTVIATKGDTYISLTIDSNYGVKNGEKIQLETPAKIINGKTMVPLRFIGESLDATISWDDKTKTISIKSVETIIVNNAQEFIDAIGSNRKIIIGEGVSLNLSSIRAREIKNPNVHWGKVYDGYELVLENIENFSIQGQDSGYSDILVEPRYANVLTFKNCSKLNFKNINVGHTTDKGSCTGGVFVFKNCVDINIEKSRLFGCGTEGLNLYGVDKLNFVDSIITDCTYDLMTIDNSSNIEFKNSTLSETTSFGELIYISNSDNVKFDNCDIYDNDTEQAFDQSNTALFDVNLSRNISIQNSKISNNKVKSIFKNLNSVIVKDTDIEEN